jgi:hypothetical protein
MILHHEKYPKPFKHNLGNKKNLKKSTVSTYSHAPCHSKSLQKQKLILRAVKQVASRTAIFG